MSLAEIEALEKELKTKLQLISKASPLRGGVSTDDLPPPLHLQDSNSHSFSKEDVRDAAKEARKITKKGRRQSGANYFANLKHLVEIRETIQAEHKKQREEVESRYTTRCQTLADSLVAIKSQCDIDKKRLGKSVSALLEGTLIQIPDDVWSQRTDKPPKSKEEEILSKELLRSGLAKISQAISRVSSPAASSPIVIMEGCVNGDPLDIDDNGKSQLQNWKQRKKKQKKQKKKQIRQEKRALRKQIYVALRVKNNPISVPCMDKHSQNRKIILGGGNNIGNCSTIHRHCCYTGKAAKENILEVFPFLTLSQAKYALELNDDNIEDTTNWLLSKEGASLEWAKSVEEKEDTSGRGELSSSPSSSSKIVTARGEPRLDTMRRLDKKYARRHSLRDDKGALMSGARENTDIGYLPLSVVRRKWNGKSAFAAAGVYKMVKDLIELPDLR
eukprot:jgi/Bigna1/74489/fgenesh1_pg.29_\